jgi:tetratricopeptide (TPR) repeat protein
MTGRKKTIKSARPPQKPDKLDLEGQLAQLENAQLVHRLTEAELTYLFKHTLTQETAYESLLLKKRREIHLRVARLYEELYPGRLDEFAALLAQHYGEAGEDAKTLEYETRAGDVAARRYANAEAYAAYSHALQIALRESAAGCSPAQDLYLKRGRVLELSGKYTEALANYDEMEVTARACGDRGMELASLMARATLRVTPTPVHDPERARNLLEHALALARVLGEPKAEAKGLWNLMLLSSFGWRPEEATQYGEQSLAIARRFNLREQMAFTLNDLAAFAYNGTGDYGGALKSLDEAKQLWRELGNQPMLADSTSNAAITQANLGQFDAAIQSSREARDISERIGNLWGQSYSRFVDGDILFERGEVDRAIHVMEECIELGNQAGFVVPSVWIRSSLASLFGAMGDVERGIELARLALQSAEARLPSWRAWPLAVLARLELLRGRGHDAERALDETHVALEGDYLTSLMIQMASAIAMARAELALAKGDPAEADRVVGKLLARLKETGGRGCLPEALLIKARAAISGDRKDEARGVLLEARSEAQARSSRRMLWRILAALSKIELERGNRDAGRELQSQAREIVEYIAANSPSELRASFLNLPETQSVF